MIPFPRLCIDIGVPVGDRTFGAEVRHQRETVCPQPDISHEIQKAFLRYYRDCRWMQLDLRKMIIHRIDHGVARCSARFHPSRYNLNSHLRQAVDQPSEFSCGYESTPIST